MFKYIRSDSDRIDKYTYTGEIKLSNCWNSGIESSVVIFENGEKCESVKEIAEHFNYPVLYFYDPILPDVTQCILIKAAFGIDILHQREFGGIGTMLRLVHYYISPVSTKECPEIIFCETAEEVDWYRNIVKIKRLNHDIEAVKNFLSDPWKEYKTKKKDFEQKLVKAEAATIHKIETETARLEELEKEKSELEKNCLLGKNKNRED